MLAQLRQSLITELALVRVSCSLGRPMIGKLMSRS